MKRRSVAIAVSWTLAAACQMPPRDSYAAAERALLRNDLPAALQAFDAVPVVHPRYPEARAAAAGVERRMRRSHESLLAGLLLRSEWRDQEALVALQRAKEIWSAMPGVDVLIRATEHRAGLFPTATAAPTQPVGTVPAAANAPVEPSVEVVAVVATPPPQAPVMPLAATAGMLDPSAPLAELAAPSGASPRAEPLPLPAAPVASPVEPRLADAIGQALVQVEARLGRGDLEGAIADLFALVERYPGEVRVRARLVRVLHQRALLRYGQGALAAAIQDWERVTSLDPAHAVARNLLAAARAEAGAAAPPPIGR